jgi:menaquinone-dependent protoporphyrinogen oxidase
MKILITYATRFGCTEKCANKLAEKLTNDVEVINLIFPFYSI